VSQAGRRWLGCPWFVKIGAAASALAVTAAVAVPPAADPGEAAAPQSVAATAQVDQIRARQWHLDAMRIPKAWKTAKGEGVTVAVLDTGVYTDHPDLVGRVQTGPDLTGGARRPGSRYWGLHGTSMASIIAGHGNGPGQARGVLGVAPGSRILSVRVTWENDDPQRQTEGQAARNRDAVAQGIRYAVDQGADIINMSLGGGRLFYDGNSTEESAIDYALDRGVVLIASAGNDGAGPNRNNFPAAYQGVIAVGALDRRLSLWKDSNRRPYVAVCAPGVEIVSADSGSGYVIGTGTSPSSAIVAGVAALIRSRYPRLEPAEVREALVAGALPGRPTGSATCKGPLDAVRAMSAASRINRRSGGTEDETRTPSPPPAPYTEPAGGDHLLLAGILGGGGLLIGIAVLLGFRHRRRYTLAYDPDDGYEDDELGDYGLAPVQRTPPSRPVAMAGHGAGGDSGVGVGRYPRNGESSVPGASHGGTYMAPVSVPIWQSTDVYAGPPPRHTPPNPSPDSPDHPSEPDEPSEPFEGDVARPPWA
jgi:type VII secretion-associated serine protease mycosin